MAASWFMGLILIYIICIIKDSHILRNYAQKLFSYPGIMKTILFYIMTIIFFIIIKSMKLIV